MTRSNTAVIRAPQHQRTVAKNLIQTVYPNLGQMWERANLYEVWRYPPEIWPKGPASWVCGWWLLLQRICDEECSGVT